MTDYELLSYKISGELTLQQVGTPAFLGWVAKRINGTATGSPYMSELAMCVAHPPMGNLSDASKIDIVRKMEKAGIQL